MLMKFIMHDRVAAFDLGMIRLEYGVSELILPALRAAGSSTCAESIRYESFRASTCDRAIDELHSTWIAEGQSFE